jgi:hypothetical protein
MANGENGNGFSFWSNFWFNLKRTGLDTLALLSIILLLYFIPSSELISDNPKIGLISIFLGKLMFISAGILHAHITRKILWKYIDFSEETDPYKKLMIIGWYLIIIFAWARGG